MSHPRILLTAASSGSGKTTIVSGILQALTDRGLKVSSFKCGPDYIDPMFHSKAIGTKSRNLDTYFVPEDVMRYLFVRSAEGSDISVIEGAMGFYDGISSDSAEGSSYDISEKLRSPVILIADCKGASLSCAAQIKGFREFRDNRIAGVIMNRMSRRTYEKLKPLVERELGVKVIGYVPVTKDFTLESRHLGLVMPDEMADIREKLSELAKLLEATVDLDALLSIAGTAEAISWTEPPVRTADGCARIGVASDEAFCFEYADNIELLERCGAEIIRFSPLHDDRLPDVDGLILYGGYPELKAEDLSSNRSMIEDIRSKLGSGMPCLAECGGFMYLGKELTDPEGRTWPMAGVIDSRFSDSGRLSRFGYAEISSDEDSVILPAHGTVRGHEFHRWDGDDCGSAFRAVKTDGRSYMCMFSEGGITAGFPHLYYYSNPEVPCRFVEACIRYSEKAR